MYGAAGCFRPVLNRTTNPARQRLQASRFKSNWRPGKRPEQFFVKQIAAPSPRGNPFQGVQVVWQVEC